MNAQIDDAQMTNRVAKDDSGTCWSKAPEREPAERIVNPTTSRPRSNFVRRSFQLVSVAVLVTACQTGRDAGAEVSGTSSPVISNGPNGGPSAAADPTEPGNSAAPAADSAANDKWNGAQWDTIEFVFGIIGISDPADEAKALQPRPQLQVVKECVEAAGFVYNLPDERKNDPRYAMDAESYARTWGFGASAQLLGTYPGLSFEELSEQNQNSDMSQSELDAYNAVQTECQESAGLDAAADDHAITAAYEFQASIESDPRVQDAVKTWSKCMAQSGYQYSTPAAMRDSFYETAAEDLGAQFELEKQVAIANLSCEPAYREVFRTVAVERFGEFESSLDEPHQDSDAGG